jgi:hypothetical protein
MTIPNLYSANGTHGPTVMSSGAFQYGIYLNAADDAIVCKRTRGANDWTTVNLRTVLGSNPMSLPLDQSDGHNSPSIGVDWRGIVHAFCNMWNDDPRYMRTVNPHDITTWVNGAATLAAPNQDNGTYAKFSRFSDGTLMLTRRTRKTGLGAASESSDDPGSEQCEVIVAGDATSTWVDRGAFAAGADGTEDALYYNQPYVDDNDRVHIMGWWDHGVGGANELNIDNHTYLYSDDMGVTWRNIAGTLLTKPIRSATTASRTGVSFGVDPLTSNFYSFGCTVDADGYPVGTASDRQNGGEGVLIRWNGSAWTTDYSIQGRHPGGQHTNVVHWRGDLWSLGGVARRCELRRVDSPNEVIKLGGSLPSAMQMWADPVALALYDSVEVLIPDGDTPRVRTAGAGARVKN